MLIQRMSAREARNGFSDLLGMVYYSEKSVIIEKRGKPFAVIINPKNYNKLLSDREARFAVFDEIRAKNPDISPRKAKTDASREITALRREKNITKRI